MSSDIEQLNVQDKVAAVFESFGEARNNVDSSSVASTIQERIAKALEGDLGDEKAHDVAFHLSDWNGDAAFLVALHLKPEMFSDQDIRDGVQGLLCHTPHHLMAAAKLACYELRDVFGVGIRVKPPHHD
jgi:hypothetical protein